MLDTQSGPPAVHSSVHGILSNNNVKSFITLGLDGETVVDSNHDVETIAYTNQDEGTVFFTNYGEETIDDSIQEEEAVVDINCGDEEHPLSQDTADTGYEDSGENTKILNPHTLIIISKDLSDKDFATDLLAGHEMGPQLISVDGCEGGSNICISKSRDTGEDDSGAFLQFSSPVPETLTCQSDEMLNGEEVIIINDSFDDDSIYVMYDNETQAEDHLDDADINNHEKHLTIINGEMLEYPITEGQPNEIPFSTEISSTDPEILMSDQDIAVTDVDTVVCTRLSPYNLSSVDEEYYCSEPNQYERDVRPAITGDDDYIQSISGDEENVESQKVNSLYTYNFKFEDVTPSNSPPHSDSEISYQPETTTYPFFGSSAIRSRKTNDLPVDENGVIDLTYDEPPATVLIILEDDDFVPENICDTCDDEFVSDEQNELCTLNVLRGTQNNSLKYDKLIAFIRITWLRHIHHRYRFVRDDYKRLLQSFHYRNPCALHSSYAKLLKHLDQVFVSKSLHVELLISLFLSRREQKRNCVMCNRQSVVASLNQGVVKSLCSKHRRNGFAKSMLSTCRRVSEIGLQREITKENSYNSNKRKFDYIREDISALPRHLSSRDSSSLARIYDNYGQTEALTTTCSDHSKSLPSVNPKTSTNGVKSSLTASSFQLYNNFASFPFHQTSPSPKHAYTPFIPRINGKFSPPYVVGADNFPQTLRCNFCMLCPCQCNYPYNKLNQRAYGCYDSMHEKYTCCNGYREKEFGNPSGTKHVQLDSDVYFLKNGMQKEVNIIDSNSNEFLNPSLSCHLCNKGYRSDDSRCHRFICYDCELKLKELNMTLKEYVNLLRIQDERLIYRVEMQEKYGNLPLKKRVKSLGSGLDEHGTMVNHRYKTDTSDSYVSYPATPMISIALLHDRAKTLRNTDTPDSSVSFPGICGLRDRPLNCLNPRRSSYDDRLSVSSFDSSSEGTVFLPDIPVLSKSQSYDRVSPVQISDESCDSYKFEKRERLIFSDNIASYVCTAVNRNDQSHEHLPDISEKRFQQKEPHDFFENNEMGTDNLRENTSSRHDNSRSFSETDLQKVKNSQNRRVYKRRQKKDRSYISRKKRLSRRKSLKS